MEKMSTKLPLSKLTGTKLWNSVIKGNKTLSEIEEQYECSHEQFMEECRRELGPEGLTKLVKADERNSKKKERETMDKKQPKQNKQTQEPKAPKQPKQLNREELERNIRAVKQQMDNASSVQEGAEAILEQRNADLQAAEEAYQEAKVAVDKANEAVELLKAKLKGFAEQLEELNNRVIYLVAPGYNGGIPEVGQMVSTLQLAGFPNLQVDKGTTLMKEPSIMEVIEAGFSDLKEVALALEYAKLVIKYQTADTPMEVKLLVDDERITTILRQQGVEI